MPEIDIRMLGDLELDKILKRLPIAAQKKLVRQSLRSEAKEVKARIVQNIFKLNLIKTGVMLAAYQKAKVKSQGNRNLIRLGVENPTRDDLGINPEDKFYYPYAVEFGGGNGPPKPFIRPAINDHKDKSIIDIGRDLGNRIEREARK